MISENQKQSFIVPKEQEKALKTNQNWHKMLQL